MNWAGERAPSALLYQPKLCSRTRACTPMLPRHSVCWIYNRSKTGGPPIAHGQTADTALHCPMRLESRLHVDPTVTTGPGGGTVIPEIYAAGGTQGAGMGLVHTVPVPVQGAWKGSCIQASGHWFFFSEHGVDQRYVGRGGWCDGEKHEPRHRTLGQSCRGARRWQQQCVHSLAATDAPCRQRASRWWGPLSWCFQSAGRGRRGMGRKGLRVVER